MDMKKTIFIFVAIGLVIPIVSICINFFGIKFPYILENLYVIQSVESFFWPSSILLLAIHNDSFWTASNFLILMLSISINIFYFFILGVIFWYGRNKNIGGLILAPLIMVIIWGAIR